MRLYLIRHGKAQRHSASGLDHDRELTQRGREQARWLGEVLRTATAPPGVVLTSPAARAVQTASLVGEGLGLPVQECDPLGLGGLASGVIELLAELDPTAPPVLVGHNPTLSIVASVLCQGPGGGNAVELRTGEAAVFDLADPANPIGQGELIELLRSDS